MLIFSNFDFQIYNYIFDECWFYICYTLGIQDEDATYHSWWVFRLTEDILLKHWLGIYRIYVSTDMQTVLEEKAMAHIEVGREGEGEVEVRASQNNCYQFYIYNTLKKF